MKNLVVVVIIFVMLGGGAFSALKWLQVGPFAPPEEMATAPEVSNEPSIFIDVNPLTINVFKNNSLEMVIQIGVKLETKGNENASFINKQLPRITSALLQELHNYLPRLLKNKDVQVDAFLLKKRMKMTTDKMFPDGEVYNVLIQSINEL